MLRKKLKSRIPHLKAPGDPEPEYCSPGSIEQQLDMCEEGELRGDEIEHRTEGLATPDEPRSDDPMEVVDEMNTYEMNFSERDREGDEMSGDDHSSGLQGGEAELEHQRHIDSGIPGADYDTWVEWPSPGPAAPRLEESEEIRKTPKTVRRKSARGTKKAG
jgi:hypothetical protein